MQKEIHPNVYPAIFLDTTCNQELVTTSTRKSEETRDIDGVTHYVHRVEISSGSHPFYTGKDRLLDTEGRVEKFKKKFKL